MTVGVTFLGPQRQPTVGRVLDSLAVSGPVATVTAGWQERESDDGELDALLGGRGTNLRLHGRWLEILQEDDEFARAEREHRVVLEELQQLYLLRLDAALRATDAVVRRPATRPRIQAMAVEDALETVRVIDATHLQRVRELHAAFWGAWRPQERPEVERHRAQIHTVLAGAECLLVAGGHVGELLQVLRLFDVAASLPARVVAWSAGAMALTQRVVLFHDRAAHGPAQTEVMDEGLSVVPGLVALPHARRRLRTDDAGRMSVLARRLAPARCVVLDDGVRLDLRDGGALPPDARVVAADGRIVEAAAA